MTFIGSATLSQEVRPSPATNRRELKKRLLCEKSDFHKVKLRTRNTACATIVRITWTSDDISIDVTDQFGCWSHCGNSGQTAFTGNCAQMLIPCPPRMHRFTIECRLDHSWDPAPGPVSHSGVKVLVEFVPADGSNKQTLFFREDVNAQYVGAGRPVQPSFGTTIVYTITQSGSATIVVVFSPGVSGTMFLISPNTITYTVSDCN